MPDPDHLLVPAGGGEFVKPHLKLPRQELQDALRRRDLDTNPLEQFPRWLGDARESGIQDPTAMTLATTGPDDQPSSRVVLLKGVDEDGFRYGVLIQVSSSANRTLPARGAKRNASACFTPAWIPR